MGYLLKQSSTAKPLVFFLTDSSDHIAGKTGLSPTVTLRKSNASAVGSFASPAGTVRELGNGWYQVDGNATDSNTLGPLILHATGTGADPADAEFNVVAFDPDVANLAANVTQWLGQDVNATVNGVPHVDAVYIEGSNDAALGLRGLGEYYDSNTAVPITASSVNSDVGTEIATAVWANATRTVTSLSGLTVDTVTNLTNHRSLSSQEIARSTARTIMAFMGEGKTGLTLVVTASKAGAAFLSISPTVTERGNGWYSLALTTTHTNTLGDLAIRITASGADPWNAVYSVIAWDKAIASIPSFTAGDPGGTPILDALGMIQANTVAIYDDANAAIGLKDAYHPGNVWWVSPSGNDSNSGLSRNATFLTLAHAYSVAVSGDTIHVVGTIDVPSPVNMVNGVHLTGDGMGRTVITSTAITGFQAILRAVTGRHYISDLTLKPATSTCVGLLTVGTSYTLEVERVEGDNSAGNDVFVLTAANESFYRDRNCVFRGTGDIFAITEGPLHFEQRGPTYTRTSPTGNRMACIYDGSSTGAHRYFLIDPVFDNVADQDEGDPESTEQGAWAFLEQSLNPDIEVVMNNPSFRVRNDGDAGFAQIHADQAKVKIFGGNPDVGLMTITAPATLTINPNVVLSEENIEDIVEDVVEGVSGAGSGSGAFARTVTVTAGAVAVANATVVMQTGATRYTATTNGSGVASFSLDVDAYTLTVSKSGYQHTPASVTVSAAGNTNTTLTAITVTPASDPARTTGYITCYGSDGQTVGAGDVTIYVKLHSSSNAGAALSHYDNEISGTSDANGMVEIPGLLREAAYSARRGTGGGSVRFITADATTSPLPEVLGHE